MSTRISMFRKALDAVVEGRSRQAQRYVDAYFADHRVARPRR